MNSIITDNIEEYMRIHSSAPSVVDSTSVFHAIALEILKVESNYEQTSFVFIFIYQICHNFA
jgi:hypothetical protein